MSSWYHRSIHPYYYSVRRGTSWHLTTDSFIPTRDKCHLFLLQAKVEPKHFYCRVTFLETSNNDLFSLSLAALCKVSFSRTATKLWIKKSSVAPHKNLLKISNSQMVQTWYNHNEGIWIFFLCLFLLSSSTPSTWKTSPAEPTFNLEEIRIFAIKLGSVRKWYRGCQQAKKEAMNINEALSEFALSSKQIVKASR